MQLSEWVYATRRPYSSLLREAFIWEKWFTSKHLNFDMQAQTQTNWCWAATATSVSHFYWLLSTWTQCKVACGELGRTDCCNSTVPAACNVPWFLDRALTRTDNFVSIMGVATFQQVRAEIDAGRPVGARVGWSGGGGHFMAIYGYSTVGGVEYFDIDDPIYGKTHLTVSEFSTNYQGSGTWTHTYFTKSRLRMPFKELILIEAVLKRIWEIRPLLQLKADPLFNGALSPRDLEASVGMAHRVYALGLNALHDGPGGGADGGSSFGLPQPEPVALRVYELAKSGPQAFFDISEGPEPRVLQTSTAKGHLEPFMHAAAEALSIAQAEPYDAELRLLRVPALNFEGLWIVREGEGAPADVVVPLRGVGTIAPLKPISYVELLDALRDAARPLLQMDDKMGA